MRPLDGIVVLDLTRLLPGAAATQLLSDFGAEVIKIEEPPRGDPGRWFPPLVGNESALFNITNRGKKSVGINLKHTRGKNAFLRMVSQADVLIESFRPGVMARLGLGLEELSPHNPRLIYAALTGYGQSGPLRSLPGHDINYLAVSGLLDLMRSDNRPPSIPPIQIADLVGGSMQVVIGVLLALTARNNTGRGQLVDAAMVDGIAPLLAVPMAEVIAAAQPEKGFNLVSGSYACYNVYQSRDDKWLAVGAVEPKFWSMLCKTVGCPEFISHQFSDVIKQSEIAVKLRRIFEEKDAAEWFELLGPACVTPVEKISLDRMSIIPRLSETPGQRGGRPPRMGEHSIDLLVDAGFSRTEVDDLARSNVIQA